MQTRNRNPDKKDGDLNKQLIKNGTFRNLLPRKAQRNEKKVVLKTKILKMLLEDPWMRTEGTRTLIGGTMIKVLYVQEVVTNFI